MKYDVHTVDSTQLLASERERDLSVKNFHLEHLLYGNTLLPTEYALISEKFVVSLRSAFFVR